MTVKENNVLSSGLLSLLVFGLFLMNGCAESPSGRVVSSPDAVTDSLPLVCTDTDGGKSYYEKGIVTNGFGKKKIDSCVGKKVREYYCKQNGTIASHYFNCRNGCRDGACLTELESTTTTNVITKYVCSDRSVVDDPGKCPEEITTTLTTTTTTATTMLPIISLKSFWDVFCGSGTDLQKDEAIRKCNENSGKYILGDGIVDEIKSESDGIYLKIIHCSGAWNPQANIKMKENQRSELLKLEKGGEVKYKAVLKQCGDFNIFYKGIEAYDGVLVSGDTLATTTTTITTTLSTSSKTTCKSSSFDIGDLVETTPLYESKTGYVSVDSHVEGIIVSAMETESGGCLIKIDTSEGETRGVLEKWLKIKTTTTTTLIEPGYLDAKHNKIEDDIWIKAKKKAINNDIRKKDKSWPYDYVTMNPQNDGWKFAVIEVELTNSGRDTVYVDGDFYLELGDGRRYTRACSYSVEFEGYHLKCYSSIKVYPGTTKKTKLCFEIPPNTFPEYLIYEQDSWVDAKKFKYEL